MDGEKLVGVITAMDLLGAFISMLGLLRSSSRLDLLLERNPQVLDAASEIIKQAGGAIINIALGPTRGKERHYVFRLEKCDLAPILAKLQEHQYQVVDVIP